MSHSSEITECVRRCLDQSHLEPKPFRHWFLKDVLPQPVCEAITDLPFAPPYIDDTQGKRETHNETRVFFASETNREFEVCRDLADALQSTRAVQKVEETCGINLRGSHLRIEYCQDTDGFWLEPHTDIHDKLYTMLVYLSTGPGSEKWGTDVYDDNLELIATAPCVFNSGLIFIPGSNTWHGFRKRPIEGVRRTLIINYVKDWNDRSQLAFPAEPVY